VLPPIEYVGHLQIRKVDHTGMIRWNNSRLFLSHTLSGETVGLEEIDEGVWSLFCGSVLLAHFDERERRFYGRSEVDEEQRRPTPGCRALSPIEQLPWPRHCAFVRPEPASPLRERARFSPLGTIPAHCQRRPRKVLIELA
jgi:hypothetical protein